MSIFSINLSKNRIFTLSFLRALNLLSSSTVWDRCVLGAHRSRPLNKIKLKFWKLKENIISHSALLNNNWNINELAQVIKVTYILHTETVIYFAQQQAVLKYVEWCSNWIHKTLKPLHSQWCKFISIMSSTIFYLYEFPVSIIAYCLYFLSSSLQLIFISFKSMSVNMSILKIVLNIKTILNVLMSLNLNTPPFFTHFKLPWVHGCNGYLLIGNQISISLTK